MDIKSLLEQANLRVISINKIMGELEDFEAVLSKTESSDIALFNKKVSEVTFVDDVLNQDDMVDLKDMVVTRIILARNNKTAELEKMLGVEKRKPATINPDFEKAILEMEEQKTEKTLVIDSGTAKCVVVKHNNPEITVEAVSKMYLEEGKTLTEVANYFGVKKEMMNGFIRRNGLNRTTYKNDGFIDAKVEAKRKERP